MRRKVTGIAIGVVAACAIVVDMFMLFFKPSMDASLSSEQSSTSSSDDTNRSSSPSASFTASSDESASSDASSSSTDTATDSASQFADGSYTGELIHTNRGDVQVQITVASGSISAVTAITYPNETAQSRSISAQVIPTYEQEAVDAQSSDIKLISGATETYTGFTGSLQDAINQATQAASS
ncbi:MAG: FMN-binding protein [Bifidobacterium sp.]|jgi:uncharacterized protein with FMN-binding domain|nr:FMN-binding protein [Bifidobacterium sp.]MCH4175027.1 FMN-binding protein [Bifidobacterium sp.]